MSSPINVDLHLRPLPSVSMYQNKWANSYVWGWSHLRVAVRSRHLTIVLKFRSKQPLKKLRNLSLSQRRGPWRFWSLLRSLDWLKLEWRCFEDMTGMNSEHKKIIQGIMRMSACCEEILREKSFVSRQTWVFDFLKSFSGIRASPHVILDTLDDNPDGPPAVLDGVCSPYTVIFLSCSFFLPFAQ
jgi:hypothetical protein